MSISGCSSARRPALPPRTLANLQKIGDAIVNFQREQPAVMPLSAPPPATPIRPSLPPPPRGYTVQKVGIAGGVVAVIAGVVGGLAGNRMGGSCAGALFAPKGVAVERP